MLAVVSLNTSQLTSVTDGSVLTLWQTSFSNFALMSRSSLWRSVIKPSFLAWRGVTNVELLSTNTSGWQTLKIPIVTHMEGVSKLLFVGYDIPILLKITLSASLRHHTHCLHYFVVFLRSSFLLEGWQVELVAIVFFLLVSGVSSFHLLHFCREAGSSSWPWNHVNCHIHMKQCRRLCRLCRSVLWDLALLVLVLCFECFYSIFLKDTFPSVSCVGCYNYIFSISVGFYSLAQEGFSS